MVHAVCVCVCVCVCVSVCVCLCVCVCCNNPPNSDMGFRIFNMCTDVNVCDCTQGHMDTERETALEVDSRKKVPCCTRESNLHQQHDSPMLYQLSYIPTLALLERYSFEGT